MKRDDSQLIKVYGLVVSYYTGKLEAYLRYKEIPYRLVAFTPTIGRMLRDKTGNSQMPAVELPDGRFMTDTTPIIDWFESQYPTPAVVPSDPLQGFVSRLVEDYAEEWLWRPAMHFRWSYRPDRMHVGRLITDEAMADMPLPGFVKRIMIRRRQLGNYVQRDGVTPETWDHVEGCYFGALDRLSDIFAKRPYLLGDVPTLADFGFFASMFRHFAQDPTASALMRLRAPAVFEWQARLWNARGSLMNGELVAGIPNDFGPLLSDIGSTYLPYLCANAEAWKAGQRRHDVTIEAVHYRDLPVSQYRSWCLERLRDHFEALEGDPQKEAQALLERHECWEPLWRTKDIASNYDPDGRVPFRGRKVHYDNA